MTETEKPRLAVLASAPDEAHQVAKVVEDKAKTELPPELRPDPTLSFMARNVSW